MIPGEKVRFSFQSGEILLESLLVLALTSLIGGVLPHGQLAYPIGLLAAFINVLRIWFTIPLKKVFHFLFRWRWLVALAVFAVMVALQLHTSNSASYASMLEPGSGVEESILFGYPKIFRTDEYAVQLPYYFSQFYNGFEEISYQMSIGGQDMIVGYNAPVLSPTLIGKPFVWGYLLFGNAYGISWYFSSKIILMFMVALELFLIVTRKKMLSVFGAFLLTFAPAMQWWFSPHFYDVLFWACTLFVVGYWFFATQGWKKWLFTLLAVSSLVGFVLALFPSLQVPCGILMLFLMLACLWRDRKKLVWKWSNLLNILIVVAGVAAVLLPALYEMREAIELLAETEYPGSRVSVGGYGKDWMLFLNISSIFQPFADPGLLNNSEISSFTHFAPAFLVLYPWLWYWMRKEKNPQRIVGDVLVIALIIQLVFLLVPLPEWFVKLTLLSYANRMQIVYGLTGTIFTVWCFAMIKKTAMPHKVLTGAVIALVYGVLSWPVVSPMLLPGFMKIVQYKEVIYLISIAMALALWLVFTKYRQLFYTVLIGWTAVSGLLVNPLMQGTASVTDYPFIDAARVQIEENPDALWLAAGYNQLPGLLLANGARVFNAVNFYPDFEKWELLDPDLDEKTTENRYAHIHVTLTGNAQSRIELEAADMIQVYLTPTDLEKLGIRYFAIAGDLTQLEILDLQPEKQEQSESAQEKQTEKTEEIKKEIEASLDDSRSDASSQEKDDSSASRSRSSDSSLLRSEENASSEKDASSKQSSRQSRNTSSSETSHSGSEEKHS